jgi:anti-sigma regulatory factor (Ser/Thr protein kinase)
LLLTSELVTNSVVHAHSPVSLVISRCGPVVRVEVADRMRGPVSPAGEPSDSRGRGLRLVETLADRWGAHDTAHGKVVWFEPRVPGGVR